MCHGVVVRSFSDGHLGCFQHLAIVNCAAVNIGVHRFFWINVSGFLGYNPSTRIDRSKRSSIVRALKKFHTVFHSGCTSLHSHQKCTRVPYCPQPRQHLVFVDLVMVTILTGVKWCLTVVLICISLMASGFSMHCILSPPYMMTQVTWLLCTLNPHCHVQELHELMYWNAWCCLKFLVFNLKYFYFIIFCVFHDFLNIFFVVKVQFPFPPLHSPPPQPSPLPHP